MARTNIFNKLKRLFSTDVVIRNIGGTHLKVIDVNKIQTTGKYQTNSLLDKFSRLYIYNNKNIFNPNLNYQTLRIQLYSDYEAMDTDPIIASALDIIADEATLKNDVGDIVTIHSNDENIQKALYNLFYDILNIEFNLWSWVRNMCKYGDFFIKLEIAEELGVYNAFPYTVYHMTRQENVDPENPGKVTFQIDPDGLASSQDPNYLPKSNHKVIELDNYEVAHFRLISDTNYLPYGRSYLEPARKEFKRMTLLEDAMLIHRIMRAPEKRVFFINVGSVPPNEVEQYMQKTINNLKKTPYVDQQTGQYNLKFNIQNMMEDFYIPTRGGDATTRVDTTPGLQYDGIQDVEYSMNKMLAALKVPKAYFGYEADISGKATLAAEDVRFARTIERIQRIFESELTKIAIIHLYSQGVSKESLTNFEIKLTTPSIVYEQEKIALLQEKVALASDMMETKLFPTDYVYENIFNISEDKYTELRELIRQDSRFAFRLAQLENEGNDPVKSGRSYGTPHDLASMYGRRSESSRQLPIGYQADPSIEHPDDLEDLQNISRPDKIKVGGRPVLNPSVVGTQKDPLGGSDRLGVHGMKGGYPSDNENVAEGGEKSSKVPIIENQQTKLVYHRNKDLLKEIDFTPENSKEDSLLNDKNIKDLDD